MFSRNIRTLMTNKRFFSCDGCKLDITTKTEMMNLESKLKDINRMMNAIFILSISNAIGLSSLLLRSNRKDE